MVAGKSVPLTLFLVLSVSAAQAVPIKLSFSATGVADSNGNPAPTDPATGVFVYEAASLGSTIDSLTSVSLTLDGVKYGVGDISFKSPFGGHADVIYGTLNGVGTNALTNDFWLVFHRVAGIGLDFSYTSASRPGTWFSQQFSSFSLSQIPAPGTLALISLGAIGFGVRKRLLR